MRRSPRQAKVRILLAALAGFLLAAGCDPAIRHRVLSTVFDDVPPPGATPPPRRAKREKRDLPKKVARAEGMPTPKPTPTPAGPVIELATEWDNALDQLPKDASGGPDWVAALSQGIIAPRSSLTAEGDTPPEPLPLDIELEPASDPNMKVVFPHAAHTEWLQCPNCHTDIFQMQKGGDKMTMADIFAGQFCGKCHGKMAFDLANCGRCHVSLAPAPG